MSRSPHDRNPRDTLIAIAMALLDQHHPEDLSLREVARRAGLTSGAPSHHFGNKLGLLAACAEVAWREMAARMEAVDGSGSPEDVLHRKSEAYVAWALANPGPYRLMTSRMFKHGDDFGAITTQRTRAMTGVLAQVARGLTHTGPMLVKRRGLAAWALLHGHISLVLDGAINDEHLEAMTADICRMAPKVALLQTGDAAPPEQP